jgi:hypothetical protein
MQLSPAAQDIVNFWTTTGVIPFKGKLISKNADGTCVMCAQGQVLLRNGYSEEALFEMGISKADKETARILGISVAHSVFLRHINDGEEGSPQEVLTNPGKYLGLNWEKVLDFWFYFDTLTEEQLRDVKQRFMGLIRKEQDIAYVKAWNAARGATEYVRYVNTYEYASLFGVSRAKAAAETVTLELIGGVENPVFVSMFYDF